MANDYQTIDSNKALLKDYYASRTRRSPLSEALNRRRKKLTRTKLGGELLADSDEPKSSRRKASGLL